MAEYMRRYNRPHIDFAPFAITAHTNAATAPHAVFNKKRLDRNTFEQAQTITGPVQVSLESLEQTAERMESTPRCLPHH